MYAPLPDDVRIAGRSLVDRDGLTLIAVFRNESYLLPAFLDHYRGLGVSRFVLLDDRSDDTSRDLLDDQPDVMVLESTRRYGDSVADTERPPTVRSVSGYRQIHLWRTALANWLCDGRWMIQCDIDEFASLPSGATLDGLANRLERDGAAGAWGGMIDLYPAHFDDLAQDTPAADDPRNGRWYFDGVRHFSLRRNGPPRHHYAGARSRLNRAYLPNARQFSAFEIWKLRALGARKSPAGRFVKPLLQKWRRGAWYLSSHETTLRLSHRVLIPLLHYRYTPALQAKVLWAMQSGGYSKNNSDYFTIDRLLSAMNEAKGSFLGDVSKEYTGHTDLVATRNARGLT
ncbi:glycosyltransferase family 2 protein [Primorskyibacter flagellatus]|uniref:Glycosyl transferase family 2 n=1 Tax=Primorskyibacter flagellatus TaxID=1387277 RepID=A0A1W2BPZ6_9RHOB|nr:glycosyltransferase family 2 protein [Primorskyibacter flagellatus]SMC75029.1 Glycosyl transferase family 2 [Primorskyibacter flagellatus]